MIPVFKKISIFLLLITLSGCGTVSNMEFYESTKSTMLTEDVKTISIGSTESKIRKVFGEPDKIDKVDQSDKTGTSNSIYLTYGNDKNKKFIYFELINGKVVRYFYSNKIYKTAKGISIGSTKKEVIKAYGTNYYVRENTGALVLGYFDKSQKLNIEFSFWENLLDGVIVSKTR